MCLLLVRNCNGYITTSLGRYHHHTSVCTVTVVCMRCWEWHQKPKKKVYTTLFFITYPMIWKIEESQLISSINTIKNVIICVILIRLYKLHQLFLLCLNIIHQLLLYNPLHLVWRHTKIMYRLCIIIYLML